MRHTQHGTPLESLLGEHGVGYFTHSLGGELGQRLGATHMLELGFVFDRLQSVPLGNQLTVSDTDARMVSRIQKA